MSIDPRSADREITRIDDRVHRARWWHISAALIMFTYTAAFYIATTAYPEATAAYVLPTVLTACAMLAFIGWRRRAVNRIAQRLEEPAIWASLALAAVTVGLKVAFRPSGLSPLTVIMGLLPALPFLVLAWRIARS